ncbi:phage protein Gp36 family protein [Porphyromonas catoniae]|jgi:hypothetical protein|uniref:DUF1320 domain-containing protein n=1 Tax=Porphyromonas catoniae ATCC 51270 TaxID=887901 RepID=Z4WZQ2_9PORP|nr:phage protein Gp36 family protein [Porphyromonas catoniae]EWC93245.1 hypothetical protein HMPREF0636_1094 [Porphyromonas catoniae ATCC 51270]DAV05671.1 MAG TPA: head to tail adaptor [Caudoviricetes sp.]
MYITEVDYRTAITSEEQAVISEHPDEWQAAERVAIELASGYLRARYDVEATFAQRGMERNPLLVQVIVHLALYQMLHRLPYQMGYERYKELYDNAIQWLVDVQKGVNNPNLPSPTNPGTGKPNGLETIRSGGLKKNTYHY